MPGATARFAMPYPVLGDPPNGPGAVQPLAEAADGWLARAFPCTSTTRPSGAADGFLIHETDTGIIRIRRGTAWRFVALAHSDLGIGKFESTAAQNLTASTNLLVSLDSTVATTPQHLTKTSATRFTIARAGLWSIDARVRLGGGASGERYLAVKLNGTTDLTGQGGQFAGTTTLSAGFREVLAAGDYLELIVWASVSGVSTDVAAAWRPTLRAALERAAAA